jgi:hypothetical protein
VLVWRWSMARMHDGWDCDGSEETAASNREAAGRTKGKVSGEAREWVLALSSR